MQDMSNKAQSIVIVDDDRHFASLVEYELEMNGFTNVKTYNDPQNFLNGLADEPYLVILDFQFDDTTGLDVLREIKTLNPEIHVIMLSGQEYISNAVSTLKYGAFDYVVKSETAFLRLQDSFGRLLSMIDRLNVIDKEIEAVNTKGKKTLRHRLGLPASFVVAVTSLFSSGS